jgi:hypothetical protein
MGLKKSKCNCYIIVKADGSKKLLSDRHGPKRSYGDNLIFGLIVLAATNGRIKKIIIFVLDYYYD